MNLNHRGSLAERFVKFSSGILAQNDVSKELFNSFSIYVPSTLAVANITDVDITGIKTRPVVVEVNVDNYLDVLKGALLAQWSPIFRQATNFDVTLYLIVFYVPDGLGTDVFADYLTVGQLTIDYSYLTSAFDELKHISFWKMMFSETYDGVATDGDYFDMALCLAQLCKNHPVLSYNLSFVRTDLPIADPDTNVCHVLSATREEEIAAATSLDVVIPTVAKPRSRFYWGMLNLMQALNTWVLTHSEQVNVFPIAFAEWFASRNAARVYVGNKLEKQRLTGSNVKPTGIPSLLNSEANENLSLADSENLDSKFVSYLMSIADGTLNDSIILRAKSVTGFPVTATAISKIIDYDVSQLIAKLMVAPNTNTNPVLRNETTYSRIKEILLASIQRFSAIGKLSNIKLNFPPFNELPASKTDIVVSAGWSADFVYDLELIQISGGILV